MNLKQKRKPNLKYVLDERELFQVLTMEDVAKNFSLIYYILSLTGT